MKICPRCKRKCLEEGKMEALNSISHIDNKTQICSICGQESGKCDMGYQTDPIEVQIHDRFKAELRKKK